MDRDLVVRARKGDRDAFTRIMTMEIARLDAVARLVIRDPERAKDAVQETLIRAWRDLPSLRDPDRFEAWLRRLLVHACIDELRQVRRRVLEVELTDLHHPAVGDSSIALADHEALERGFRRLDANYRSVIVLHYYLGLPLPEVADALGAPVGTVKARLHRAREALRAALDADARDQIALAEDRLA